MQDLEAFGIAVAGIARDLQDENAALRAKIATLEAQLAAVTPWRIVGRVPTEEDVLAIQECIDHLDQDWADTQAEREAGTRLQQSLRTMLPVPKPAHIP